jgi:hypothetical protein
MARCQQTSRGIEIEHDRSFLAPLDECNPVVPTSHPISPTLLFRVSGREAATLLRVITMTIEQQPPIGSVPGSARETPTQRAISCRTTGGRHGSIVRLMSPSDLGHVVKPLVFLDLFEGESSFISGMPMHLHSGIATITVITEGNLRFEDADSGKGTIDYGGVEWMRAGGWWGLARQGDVDRHIEADSRIPTVGCTTARVGKRA